MGLRKTREIAQQKAFFNLRREEIAPVLRYFQIMISLIGLKQVFPQSITLPTVGWVWMTIQLPIHLA